MKWVHRAAVALAALAPGQVAAQTFSATAPQPIVVLIVNPLPEAARVRISEVHQALDSRFRERTGAYAELLEPAVDDCAGRLSCWISRLIATAPSRFEEGPGAAPLLITLSIRSQEGAPDSVVTMIVDPLEAAQRIRGFDLTRPDDALAADAALGQSSILVRIAPAQLESPADLDGFAAMVLGQAAGALEQRGLMELGGLIELTGAPQNAVVELDERVLGVTSSTVVRIERAPPGLHRVTLTKPQFEPFTAEIQIGARRHHVLAVVMEPIPETHFFAQLDAPNLLAAGVFALAGAAIVTGGLIDQGNVSAGCLGDMEVCSRPMFARFDSGISSDGSPGSGPLMIPLGYSLGAAALVTFVIDGLWAGDDASDILIPIGLGLAAGALTYGLTEALHP